MKAKIRYRISLFVRLMLIFTFYCSVLSAQNKGVVMDGISKSLLAGVNIYLNNKKVISKTNESGEFIIKKLARTNKNDTLFFSHVGYSVKKVSISDLKENENKVYLFKDTLSLKEITVISNKPTLDPSIKYEKMTPLNIGVYSFGAALIGDKIYVIGGNETYEDNDLLDNMDKYVDNGKDDAESFLKKISSSGSNFNWSNYCNKLQVYDIATDYWQNSNLKFGKRAYHNINYSNNKIYVLGGKQLSTNRVTEYLDNKIEVYDINRNKVITDKTNPHQAINFASFSYNNNLIIMGGSTKLKMNGEKEYSNKAHLLDLKSGLWYKLPDMPSPKETKGVAINATIYLIGGFNNRPLKEIESYNIGTGKWNTEGELSYEVERPAIAYNEDIIYIFEDRKIQTYNIKTKEKNAYLIDLSLKFSELLYANNMLYILGGLEEYSFSKSPSRNLYRIDLLNFKKTMTLINHQ